MVLGLWNLNPWHSSNLITVRTSSGCVGFDLHLCRSWSVIRIVCYQRSKCRCRSPSINLCSWDLFGRFPASSGACWYALDRSPWFWGTDSFDCLGISSNSREGSSELRRSPADVDPAESQGRFWSHRSHPRWSPLEQQCRGSGESEWHAEGPNDQSGTDLVRMHQYHGWPTSVTPKSFSVGLPPCKVPSSISICWKQRLPLFSSKSSKPGLSHCWSFSAFFFFRPPTSWVNFSNTSSSNWLLGWLEPNLLLAPFWLGLNLMGEELLSSFLLLAGLGEGKALFAFRWAFVESPSTRLEGFKTAAGILAGSSGCGFFGYECDTCKARVDSLVIDINRVGTRSLRDKESIPRLLSRGLLLIDVIGGCSEPSSSNRANLYLL